MRSRLALGILLFVPLSLGMRTQITNHEGIHFFQKRFEMSNETATVVPVPMQWNTDPEESDSPPSPSFLLDQTNTPPLFQIDNDPTVRKIIPWLKKYNSGRAPEDEEAFLYGLTEFTVWSPSLRKYLTFRRAQGRPESIVSQVIFTVQKGSPRPHSCDSDIDSRIDCALAADKCERMGSDCKGAYGPFVMTHVQPETEEQYSGKIPPYPDTPRMQSCTAVGLAIRADWSSVSGYTYNIFKFLSLKGYWCLFTKITPTMKKRTEYAKAYNGKRYDDQLASTGTDIATGLVFPFPGATAWTIQAKWAEEHDWSIADSPILDYDADWSEQFVRLQTRIASEPLGSSRVRIYFVGHSSAGDGKHGDGFFGNSERRADAVSIRYKLERSKYPEILGYVPVTMSFVACRAACYLCPELSKHLHSFARMTELHCRIPRQKRYTGGDFKKYTSGEQYYEHKLNQSKLVFRPGSMIPDAAWDAYGGGMVKGLDSRCS